MSVLPPKADIAEHDHHVRFVPKADKKPMFAMPAAPPKMESVAATDYLSNWVLGT